MKRLKTLCAIASVIAITGLGVFDLAYAKEISNEGWPLPDETQYLRLTDPSIRGIACEYKGQKVNVNVKIEPYVNVNSLLKSYVKYSFEDRAYMYVIMEPANDAIKTTILADVDGNGSLETKYDVEKDEEEFKKDGFIPRWILEKVMNR